MGPLELEAEGLPGALQAAACPVLAAGLGRTSTGPWEVRVNPRGHRL